MAGINPKELMEIFTHTSNVNNEIRQQAERRLLEIERMENYVPTLLQLTGQEIVTGQLRQMIAIRFKNHIAARWKSERPEHGSQSAFPLSDRDKEFVKNMLYDAIVTQTESLVAKQLLEAFFIIGREAFPGNWTVLESIQRDLNLSEEHFGRVLGSLSCLRMLCKKYQFKARSNVKLVRLADVDTPDSVISQAARGTDAVGTMEIRRNTLDDLVDMTFPRLEQIASNLTNLLPRNNNNNRAYEMLKPIFQIFYYAIHMGLPVYFLSQQHLFDKWMEIFLQFLRQPVPGDLVAACREAATGTNGTSQKLTRIHPFSKAQKWAVRCVTRIFYDHGRYQYVGPHLQAFARKFQHDIAPLFLEAILNNVIKVYGKNCEESRTNNFSCVVYHKTLSCAIMYVTVCIHYGNLCKTILEEFDVIVFKCLYPIICLNMNDIEMWADNPHEFVRRLYSELLEEKYDPRVAALRTIFELVRIRTKFTLSKVVDVMVQRVKEYDAVLSSVDGNMSAPQVRQASVLKEGALAILGELHYQLVNGGDEMCATVEDLLVNHVIHDFNRSDGLLRFRACKFVGEFFGMDLKNESMRYHLAEAVTGCLNDPELPVQLEAANSFPKLIANDSVLSHLAPTIPEILERYLMLMDEIGIEHVMTTFDMMIDRLGDNLAPFAEALTDRMIALFNRLHASMDSGAVQSISDINNCVLSCVQVLRSLSTIVFAVHPLNKLLRTIQQKLFPLFETYFNQQNGENFATELLDLIAAVTYYDGPDLHPFLWERVLPNVIEMQLSWDDENLNKVVNIISNFLSLRGTANLTHYVFNDGVVADFMDQFLTVYMHCVKDDNVDTSSLGSLTDVIFTYLKPDGICFPNKGGVPNAKETPVTFTLHKYMPQLLTECCDTLSRSALPETQNCVLRTVAAMMFYDARYCMKMCEDQNVLQPLLGKFKDNMEEMTWPEQKVVVFGLSELLGTVPLNDMSHMMISHLPATIDLVAEFVCFMNYDDDEDQVETAMTTTTAAVDTVVDDSAEHDIDPAEIEAVIDLSGIETNSKPFLNLPLSVDYTDGASLTEAERELAVMNTDEPDTFFRYLDRFGEENIMPHTPFDDHDEVISFNTAITRVHAQNANVVGDWKRNVDARKLAMLETYLKTANANMAEFDLRKERQKRKEQQTQDRLSTVMKEANARQQATQQQEWLT